MNILIFGGSFDPIHNAHIELLISAQTQFKIDKTFVIPSKNVTYKTIDGTGLDRINMLHLAIDKLKNTEISDYELLQDNDQISYSINTIRHYQSLYKNDQLFLLIGADQLVNFHKWKDYLLILNLCQLLVYKRSNAKIDDLIEKYNAKLVTGNELSISSTYIKNCLIDSKNLNKNVYQYILEHGLYYQYWLLKYISQRRLEHSIRVAQYAKDICVKSNIPLANQAWIAGIYHDLAKEFKYDQLVIAANKLKIETYHPKIWHGPIGADFLKLQGFNNQEILNAIARHTVPSIIDGEISLLDKIIYCADKLEPNRTDEDVQNIIYYRNLFNQNISQCFDELIAYFKKIY